jgi:hypothetical protein
MSRLQPCRQLAAASGGLLRAQIIRLEACAPRPFRGDRSVSLASPPEGELGAQSSFFKTHCLPRRHDDASLKKGAYFWDARRVPKVLSFARF